ncbi:hypothetical protein TWF281_001669 [Arthrobotrys megalospora]
MRVTTFFKVGLAVFNLFAIGTFQKTNALTIPADPKVENGVEHKDFITHHSGKRMPITPLRVEGELYPGGPKFDLQGHGIHGIEEQLLQHPLYNSSAFDNSTLEFLDEGTDLHKRSRQIYYCERKPRAIEGVIPEDIKPAVDRLRQPPWQHAFCYAAPGSCTFLGCGGTAGIFLCNHRPTWFRTICGSACGRFAFNIYNRMMKDKQTNSVDWPASGNFPLCVGWYVDTFRYIGWSKLDTDTSWEVNIVPYHGKPCSGK